MSKRCLLDVIVPVFNEEDVLGELCNRLIETFKALQNAHEGLIVRALFIDDGSRDRTATYLADRIRTGFPGRMIRLSRNFGHLNAITAGLHFARGDAVVVMDADLQDPPELILDMVQQWKEGADVAYALRRRREGHWIKRVSYWTFYRLVSVLSDVDMPRDTGEFCLMSRRVVNALNALPEKQRFTRGLRAWVGFRQVAVKYDRPERLKGHTKYGWRQLYGLATDGIASMSTRPLKLAQIASVAFVVTAFVGVVALWVGAWGNRDEITAGWRIVLLVVLMGNGVLAFCMYLIGAYLGRAYLEVKGRPPFIVMETVENEQLYSESEAP